MAKETLSDICMLALLCMGMPAYAGDESPAWAERERLLGERPAWLAAHGLSVEVV